MRKGFILVEMLLSLIVASVVMNMGQSVLQIQARRIVKIKDINHEIFRIQMRRFIHTAKYIDGCKFSRNTETIQLVIHNDRLVQTPGYHILLEGVSNVHCSESKINYEYKAVSYEVE